MEIIIDAVVEFFALLGRKIFRRTKKNRDKKSK